MASRKMHVDFMKHRPVGSGSTAYARLLLVCCNYLIRNKGTLNHCFREFLPASLNLEEINQLFTKNIKFV